MGYSKKELKERARFRQLCIAEGREGNEARRWDLADAIIRDATSYNRIQERWCSEEMSDRATKALERREGQIERRIRNRCELLGFRVEFGGDPRGYCVRVFVPSGKSNTWGGAECGYGVPCGAS